MAYFPFPRYPYYNRYPQNPIFYHEPEVHNTSSNDIENSDKDTDIKDTSNTRESPRYNSFGPIHFQNPLSLDEDDPVLEIFGIKLYLDDLIILGILFFLYKEGVKDEMLFLSLILLLLS